MPNDRVTESRLRNYLAITEAALEDLTLPPENSDARKPAVELVEMARAYFKDAKHFYDKGNYVDAFACVNYAHGWLDAGARLRLFEVKNRKLFALD